MQLVGMLSQIARIFYAVSGALCNIAHQIGFESQGHVSIAAFSSSLGYAAVFDCDVVRCIAHISAVSRDVSSASTVS